MPDQDMNGLITCENTFKLCLESHRKMFKKFKNMNNIKSISESAFFIVLKTDQFWDVESILEAKDEVKESFTLTLSK